MDRLRKLRFDAVQLWLKSPAGDLAQLYANDGGRLYQMLLTGPAKDFPLSESEREMAEHLLQRIASSATGPELARFLLAAMLYLEPYDMPQGINFMRIPEWLRYHYFEFLLSKPKLAHRLGETRTCHEQLDRLTSSLYDAIIRQPHSPVWQKMATIFAEKANLQPLYFSWSNLKPIAVRRAAIVDYVTGLKGHDLEYTMPHRRHRSDRIRLGIYSWSLRLNTETFATLPIFAHLDSGAFDVHLYVHRSDANPIERRARRMAGSLTVLPETVKGSVAAIRADDLDILVFGNNVTAGGNFASNLANYRMARMQCIHFCSPVTSGKRNIDCFLLGASIAARLDVAAHFTERILSIEGSGICFDLPDPPAGDSRGISRQSLGIPAGRPIFISGANYFKIIPELRHTWAKILSQVPDSVLLLYPFGPAWAPLYPQQRLREEVNRVFEQYGISAERVIVVDTQQGRGEVLALNRCADVYLDAIPYNGATSLLDPLQEGVPPVVLDGRELRFAQGAAMLRELGIPELVTEKEDEYVELAVRLGCDASLRNAMRVRVLERMRGTPDFLNPQLYGRRVSHALLSLFADSSAVQPRRSVSCTESRPTL